MATEQVSAAAAIVLAAGEGSRMKSEMPKVLHRAAGRPLLVHVLAALDGLPLGQRIVVTSTRRPEIEAAVGASGIADGLTWVVQDPPRGTGDAVRVALDAVGESGGAVLVLPGDAPLIETATLDGLMHVHFSRGASATVLIARISDPTGYGRVIRSPAGDVMRIVEDRDAGYEERTVDEINAGVYMFSAPVLERMLDKIDRDNAQGEYYLTDVIELLHREGETVLAYRTHPQEVLGVNSRAQLARVTELLRRQACERWMDEGVTIVDPTTTYIDASVTVGRDAVIHPFTFLEGKTAIGERAEVGPVVRIVDSQIAPEATVREFSVVEASVVGPGASVGPNARLRQGTTLERGARIGSFVETKQVTMGEGSRANHLTYLGDADIGRGVNIGAGTVTCNYDGRTKHATVIEDDAYIGSDTMLVAPAHVGKRAATGAGSVVLGSVPDDALAVGVPARILPGRGNKMGRARADDEGSPADEEPRR